MASVVTFNCSLAAPLRSSAGSGRKPDSNRRKTSSSTWWAPIFGWSSDPDYVDNSSSDTINIDRSGTSESELESQRPRSKYSLGCFTEDKAKQLRKKTMENNSFHDRMYHSAIASRLAFDTPGKSDQ